MYKGYELRLTDLFLQKLSEKVELQKTNSKIMSATKRLQTYILESETIDASFIATNIFEIKQFDVFLSHSYQDVDSARKLANYLQMNMGLNVFVDSNVWGNYENILKAIDKKYCLDEDLNTYRYHDRNKSTAHLHMILMTSLMKMINECEAFFFLHSAKSINHFDSLGQNMASSQKTYSPWIHSELQFSAMVQRNSPHRWDETVMKSVSLEEHHHVIPVLHDAPTDHLTELTDEHFHLWQNRRRLSVSTHGLDHLYDIIN